MPRVPVVADLLFLLETGSMFKQPGTVPAFLFKLRKYRPTHVAPMRR
jgi:hypothetical protein